MLWHEGAIENAVNKVKSTGSLLLVFVQGDDNLSKQYESCLNEKTYLKDGAYVAVKLTRDSATHQQFKQIYVNVPIPSVFLIQNNGIPLHVISTHKISEMHDTINKAVTMVNNEFENKKKVENKMTETTKKSLEEPLSKPLEQARNVGQKIVDVSEEELKQRLKEIRAFPQFLLIDSLIELDPVPDVALAPEPAPTLTSPRSLISLPLRAHQPPKTHSARIQFRLPNNETPSWEFPDLSTLRDVRAYITEKIKLPSNFKLMRAYPRTAFTPKDEYKTLSELSLMPNATLIVVPVQDKKLQPNANNPVSRPFFLSAILNALFLPLITIVKFFRKHIFGERDQVENDGRAPSAPAPVRRNQRPRKSGSNIHGFKFDREESDGEHPDNGNSTQQSYHKK